MKIILKVNGMTCAACSSSLEKYLNKQPGINNAAVNLVLGNVSIDYENLSLETLEKYIDDCGFESAGIYEEIDINKENRKEKKILIIYTILIIVVMIINMLSMFKVISINKLLHIIFLFICSILFLYYGQDIIKSGIKSFKSKNWTMDTLVTIAVLSSFIYSLINAFITIFKANNVDLYFESMMMVIYFVKLGRYIDHKSFKNIHNSLEELVKITPEKALLKVSNNVVEVSIDQIVKGDILVALPGEKIAVDGIVSAGNSHLDVSFLTGESRFKKVQVQDKIMAGSINLDGKIEYIATDIGRDSTISKIVEMVSESMLSKPKLAKLADTICSYFVPGILVIALLTFIVYLFIGTFSVALIHFITILCIACPCALGLATPLAVVISTGVFLKYGILVKKSETLEKIRLIDTIIFDKTGTLTNGNLSISKIFNYSSLDDNQLINIVSALEKNSLHPIATAFKYNESKLPKVKEFKNIDGIGIMGIIDKEKIYIGNNKLFKLLKINNTHENDEELLRKKGNSILYIIKNNNVIGLIGITDNIKNDAFNTIKLLKENYNIIMLTGDNLETAKIIGKQLGITNIKADLLPNDKAKVIKELLKNNHHIMMIGDGINDAPSLSLADVSISFNNSSDIAYNSADIILIGNELSKILKIFKISHKTILNIKENLAFAFIYNIIMIPIAMGLFKITINPEIASISMTLSSISVVLNSLRLNMLKRRHL